MWNSKGRSGYGNTNLEGTYEDVINGISPNGRQYRNEITGETRNLDGWSYWNLRKQNTPEQKVPDFLHTKNEQANLAHTLKNGQANLAKYADPVVPKKPSKVPLKNKILPQAVRVEGLTQQMRDLVAEYKQGLHTLEEYTLLLSVVSAKRARAEELLAKAVSVKAPFEREEEIPNVSEGMSSTNETLSREILSENKRSALKRKEPKAKTEKVKHDRKSLSKVADWINRNSFIYFIGCSTIALTAAKIIF